MAADVSSFTIDGLKPDLSYSVFVSALSDSREGAPSILNVRTGTTLNVTQLLLFPFWQQTGNFSFPLWLSGSDQSVVGTVTSLQVQEARGEVVRVTWVGVQGATSYRVSWKKTDGGFIVACELSQYVIQISSLVHFFFTFKYIMNKQFFFQMGKPSQSLSRCWENSYVASWFFLMTVAVTILFCRWWREESAGRGRGDRGGFRPAGPWSSVRGAGHGFGAKPRRKPCVCQGNNTWVSSSYVQMVFEGSNSQPWG